jgi:hypothetical protein
MPPILQRDTHGSRCRTEAGRRQRLPAGARSAGRPGVRQHAIDAYATSHPLKAGPRRHCPSGRVTRLSTVLKGGSLRSVVLANDARHARWCCPWSAACRPTARCSFCLDAAARIRRSRLLAMLLGFVRGSSGWDSSQEPGSSIFVAEQRSPPRARRLQISPERDPDRDSAGGYGRLGGRRLGVVTCSGPTVDA